MTPILYVKSGCPYCKAAVEYLDDEGISYDTVDVRGDDQKMQKLQELSGQTKTPTLDWDGDVLADFGVDELEEFLAKKQAA
jgi:glutaredoxin 3